MHHPSFWHLVASSTPPQVELNNPTCMDPLLVPPQATRWQHLTIMMAASDGHLQVGHSPVIQTCQVLLALKKVFISILCLKA